MDPRSWAAIRAKEAWLQDRLSTTALEEAEAAALHAAQAAYAKAMFPGASDADRRRAHAARAANWAACDIAHRRALESFTRDIFRITLAEEVLSKETLEALIQSMVRPLEQARRGLVFVLLQRKHQAQPQPLYPLHKGFEDALFDEA